MLYVSTVNLPPSLGRYIVVGVHCESCNVGVPAPKNTEMEEGADALDAVRANFFYRCAIFCSRGFQSCLSFLLIFWHFCSCLNGFELFVCKFSRLQVVPVLFYTLFSALPKWPPKFGRGQKHLFYPLTEYYHIR